MVAQRAIASTPRAISAQVSDSPSPVSRPNAESAAALFSIIAILIPLSRILPPLYQFRVRSRVFRWYRQLRLIEDRHVKGKAPAADNLLCKAWV